MWDSIQRLWLGLILICCCSAILLISDTPRPKLGSVNAPGASVVSDRIVRVAMFQLASNPIIDEGAAGVLLSLKEAGYVADQSMKLRRFNAEGDVSVANAIAQELVGGDYDLLITLTTGALQAVANANQQRKIPHVFGLVSDPIKSGVGIGTEPLDHPAHLVGIGTFPPVDEALALAKKIEPAFVTGRLGLAPRGDQFRGLYESGPDGMSRTEYRAFRSERRKYHGGERRGCLAHRSTGGGVVDRGRCHDACGRGGHRQARA